MESEPLLMHHLYDKVAKETPDSRRKKLAFRRQFTYGHFSFFLLGWLFSFFLFLLALFSLFAPFVFFLAMLGVEPKTFG